MTIRLFLSILLAVGLLSSCGSKKKAAEKRKKAKTEKTVTPKTERDLMNTDPSETNNIPSETEKINKPVFKDNAERYVYEYADIAIEEMKLYGIPASITLAQGVLESNSGNGELTLKSNNHFGIKCNGWQGAKVYHDDDAYQECFRKYNDPKYSFRDHSLFLSERSRYAALFELDIDDYKGWARGLKSAGYATDPRYPNKLISIIERYDLQKYDKIGTENSSSFRKNSSPEKVKVDYTSIRHTVKKGDTLYSISKKYNISVEELKTLNKLKDNTISVGQKLYVKSL